jgi:hypothetical protein
VSAFVNFLFIGLISNQFTCSHDILKIKLDNFLYNFNIKLNYKFKTWKNQISITLVMVRVIVTTCMTYLAIKINFNQFFFQILNMPCGNFKNCATCHNFKPSLTIIMDDANQFFLKKMSKNIHNVMCQILIYRWQLMTLTWHHGCSYNGVA